MTSLEPGALLPGSRRALNHPRRPPAHRSVSLKHPSSKSDDVSSNNAVASQSASATNSPSSLEALIGKGSSGESSNADRWFDASNNEVRNTGASFADNEPPFFIQHSSSETPPEDLAGLKRVDDRVSSLHRRTGLLHLETGGSSSDDYRGVIDDLTIENKKLKRKLKRYEKLHDAHLQDEKLFEVRIHGLPPDKKRELEETLRQFTASLDTTGLGIITNKYGGLVPSSKARKASSSQPSLQNTDSAYASMSASGLGSSAQSSFDRRPQMTPATQMASRRQNIHEYLHHIPEGLLPQQNSTALSERAKKKLVVRRLEQLFAGKGSPGMDNQQSLQQEEVSQSAATADRTAIEASGRRTRQEGSREANIMLHEAKDDQELGPDHTQTSTPHQQHPGVAPLGMAAKQSPVQGPSEQRPTRPLDLDPHRAQVATENIQYMRHLGFSPPHPGSGKSPVDGHGWIYLNFLINMAQLHTINVTDGFVRKALADIGSNFEVSTDGRKVRWKGGASITRTSSAGEASSHGGAGEESPEGQSPRKRVKFSHDDGARSKATSSVWQGSRSQRQQGSRKYVYTPLFSHRDSSDGMDSSASGAEAESVSSPFQAPFTSNGSGMTGTGGYTTSGRTVRVPKRISKRNDGPIIFYNNARFCTDLSGDHGVAERNVNPPMYDRTVSVPVGKIANASEAASERRGPLAQATVLPEPMDLDDNPIPASMELTFQQQAELDSGPLEYESPITLQASGIGGVRPADNFTISVNSRHAHVKHPQTSDLLSRQTLPPSVAQILHSSDAKRRPSTCIQRQILSSDVKQMPPAELPDALAFMPSDEGSTGDGEYDDETSDAGESGGTSPLSVAPQPVYLPYTSDHEADEEDEDSADDGESDGEVDFLAQARQLDPEAVRQQEREYDAYMAERLAEEIPAGSSAATAGRGSGFASPQYGMTKAEHQRASLEARVKAANLRRAPASKMQDTGGSSDGEAEMNDASS